MAFSGVLAAVVEMAILPWLQHKFGSLFLYKLSMVLWPPIFLSFPFINYLARSTIQVPENPSLFATGGVQHPERPPAGMAVWSAIAIQLTAQRVASMAYPYAFQFPQIDGRHSYHFVDLTSS